MAPDLTQGLSAGVGIKSVVRRTATIITCSKIKHLYNLNTYKSVNSGVAMLDKIHWLLCIKIRVKRKIVYWWRINEETASGAHCCLLVVWTMCSEVTPIRDVKWHIIILRRGWLELVYTPSNPAIQIPMIPRPDKYLKRNFYFLLPIMYILVRCLQIHLFLQGSQE